MSSHKPPLVVSLKGILAFLPDNLGAHQQVLLVSNQRATKNMGFSFGTRPFHTPTKRFGMVPSKFRLLAPLSQNTWLFSFPGMLGTQETPS